MRNAIIIENNIISQVFGLEIILTLVFLTRYLKQLTRQYSVEDHIHIDQTIEIFN